MAPRHIVLLMVALVFMGCGSANLHISMAPNWPLVEHKADGTVRAIVPGISAQEFLSIPEDVLVSTGKIQECGTGGCRTQRYVVCEEVISVTRGGLKTSYTRHEREYRHGEVRLRYWEVNEELAFPPDFPAPERTLKDYGRHQVLPQAIHPDLRCGPSGTLVMIR